MIDILYEDQDIIVVVKPAGVPSQKDLSKDLDVYTMVCNHTGMSKVGLVQRLDRPVGGIMVLTKSVKANQFMTNAIQDHKIDKTYLAVVNGSAKESDCLENYIQKVRGNRAVVSNKKVANAKKALLTYKCLDRQELDGSTISLLEVQLETGRFHQIRAQLSHHKLPIVGDTKYNQYYKDRKGWHNIGLMAYRLAFEHPVNGQQLTFTHTSKEEPFSLFGKTIRSIER